MSTKAPGPETPSLPPSNKQPASETTQQQQKEQLRINQVFTSAIGSLQKQVTSREASSFARTHFSTIDATLGNLIKDLGGDSKLSEALNTLKNSNETTFNTFSSTLGKINKIANESTSKKKPDTDPNHLKLQRAMPSTTAPAPSAIPTHSTTNTPPLIKTPPVTEKSARVAEKPSLPGEISKFVENEYWGMNANEAAARHAASQMDSTIKQQIIQECLRNATPKDLVVASILGHDPHSEDEKLSFGRSLIESTLSNIPTLTASQQDYLMRLVSDLASSINKPEFNDEFQAANKAKNLALIFSIQDKRLNDGQLHAYTESARIAYSLTNLYYGGRLNLVALEKLLKPSYLIKDQEEASQDVSYAKFKREIVKNSQKQDSSFNFKNSDNPTNEEIFNLAQHLIEKSTSQSNTARPNHLLTIAEEIRLVLALGNDPLAGALNQSIQAACTKSKYNDQEKKLLKDNASNTALKISISLYDDKELVESLTSLQNLDKRFLVLIPKYLKEERWEEAAKANLDLKFIKQIHETEFEKSFSSAAAKKAMESSYTTFKNSVFQKQLEKIDEVLKDSSEWEFMSSKYKNATAASAPLVSADNLANDLISLLSVSRGPNLTKEQREQLLQSMQSMLILLRLEGSMQYEKVFKEALTDPKECNFTQNEVENAERAAWMETASSLHSTETK